MSGEHENKHYFKLGVMFALHFIAMYILMYAMVHRLTEDVYNSLNQIYMAGLMTASMGVIELAIMGAMYPNKQRNTIILVVSAVALVGFGAGIRQQTAIGDKQFIRSMIPHHSGAILMCQEASITDGELQKLCNGIVSGQQSEIDQMRAILARLDRK